ncbi:MAG: GNAT family N-acetyltransferase [Candidatus Izemoplasmatales bacterium]
MSEISLKKITIDNFDQVIKLSDTLNDYQKKCVAPNLVSLAQAYVEYERAWPRVIYLHNEPIGFVMLALWDDDIPKDDWPAYYLWRFMISAQYQAKGYGKKVLDIIVNKCKEDKIKTLYTSCEMSGNQPYDFYIKYGFEDTGINDGEQILRMLIS